MTTTCTETPNPPRSEHGIEQRRHVRVPYHLQVTVYGEKTFAFGVVRNISRGGCFVATHQALDKDSQVQLDLELPAGTFPVKGVVAWTRPWRGYSRPPGMGLRFEQVSADLASALGSYVEGILNDED